MRSCSGAWRRYAVRASGVLRARDPAIQRLGQVVRLGGGKAPGQAAAVDVLEVQAGTGQRS